MLELYVNLDLTIRRSIVNGIGDCCFFFVLQIVRNANVTF